MDGGLVAGELTHRILASAFKVHGKLGAGLLETAYRECFVKQLTLDGMKTDREQLIDINYEGLVVPGAFRADVIVEDEVIVELKSVECVLPIHQAQLLTYLRLSGLRVGLLLNFNTRHLRHGIHRFVA